MQYRADPETGCAIGALIVAALLGFAFVLGFILGRVF